MDFLDQAKIYNTVEKAYIPLNRWGMYERSFYNMKDIFAFKKWVVARFGHNFEIYFDRRRDLATIDELRGKGSDGKMTYVVFRNPWNGQPEVMEDHKRQFIDVYTKFKNVEERINKKELAEAFQY